MCREGGPDRFYGSPGSRSAPLLLSLLRTAGLEVCLLGDERSAAYRALGYALGSAKPAGLFCTSGTAVLNFGPAIAEAFYQKIPLLLATADRPPELIDQQEGQAVRQHGIFQAHTVYSAGVPSHESSEVARIHSRRIFNEAFQACSGPVRGPVHLNFPIREPFYPDSEEDFSVTRPLRRQISRPEFRLPREELSSLIEIWNRSARRLLLAGQMPPDSGISNACKALTEYAECPVLGDMLHNLEMVKGCVLYPDLLQEGFLSSGGSRADVIISIGNGFLSKSVLKYLKENPPAEHWHIAEDGFPADAAGSITRVIQASPEWLITRLAEASCFSEKQNRQLTQSWYQNWLAAAARVKEVRTSISASWQWSDLHATDGLLKAIPTGSVLFLASSMPVRYAAWLYEAHPAAEIFSNRGTSGIDGCLSTAMGIADARPQQTVFALLGDMAFLYDRNALWTNKIPPNLKIMVLNNGGGNIFRILPASSGLPEMEDYFEMQQNQTAKGTCTDAGIPRFECRSAEEYPGAMQNWLAEKSCALLEVFTDKAQNHRVVQEFREAFR